MNEYVDAGAAAELEDGSMKTVKAGEREILIARVGERYFAAQSRCPHMGGELSQGTLEGTIVTCPVHHSRFDLTDGRTVRWTDWSGIVLSMAKVFRAPRPLTVYEAKVEDGRILVGTEQKPLREQVPAQ